MDQFECRLVIHADEEKDTISVLDPADYSADFFLPKSKNDLGALLQQLRDIAGSVQDQHYSALLGAFLSDSAFAEGLKFSPSSAAKHHPYVGGLLEHTLAVAKMCDFACHGLYPGMDRDLLVAAAILHDCGKLQEYSLGTSINRSDEGRLLRHISLGEQMIMEKLRKIPDFPAEKRLKLLHIIANHHARPDGGVLIGVKTPEAHLLHRANSLDSGVDHFMRAQARGDECESDWFYARDLGHEVYLK